MIEDSHQEIISYLEDNLQLKNINYNDLLLKIYSLFPLDIFSKMLCYIIDTKNDHKLVECTIRFLNKCAQDETVLNSLIDLLFRNYEDKKFLDIKVLTIKTIAKYKNTIALPALLYCLNNKNSNYKIRLAAAEALGKIGDKNAFDSLSNVAKSNEENSTYVKESAITALGMLGDTRAIDVFSSIMNTNIIFSDKFSFLKEKIMEAISKFDISNNDKAIKLIQKSLLDNNYNVRISAIEALMNSDIEDNFNLIYNVLKNDDNFEVKKNALIALYNLSDRKILDDVLKDEFDENLKEYAKKLIQEYED